MKNADEDREGRGARGSGFGAQARRAVIWALILPIRAYRKILSPALPRRCRYEPTCAAYAMAAVRRYGVVRGLTLAGWRLLRCNPLSDGGFDPVEAQGLFRRRAHGADGIEGRSSGSEVEHHLSETGT